jgi:hypothetical protein
LKTSLPIVPAWRNGVREFLTKSHTNARSLRCPARSCPPSLWFMRMSGLVGSGAVHTV